eukprot:m.24101 g.24101  ORF g.24101 m.24101 type:complete len:505 (-) comp5617_c0_seq1:1048-2562(-)
MGDETQALIKHDKNTISDGPHGHHGTNSWFQSGTIVIANMLGAGVLGLPYACRRLGWISSVVVLTLITLFSIYGALLLGWLRGNDNSIVTYGQLADKVARSCGMTHNFWRHFVQIIGTIYVIGALTIYLTTCRLAMMQIFQKCPSAPSNPSCGQDSCTKHDVVDWSSNVWLVLAAALLFPVIQIRSLSETGIVSYIGVGTIAIVNLVVLGHLIWDSSKHSTSSTTKLFPDSLQDFVNGMTQLSFAYGGHVIMVDIQSAMKKPTDWNKAVYFSQTFMFANYAIIGFLGYSAYGSSTSTVVTAELADNWLRICVNICLFLHVAMAYCINSTVVTTFFVNLFFPKLLQSDMELKRLQMKLKTIEQNGINTTSDYTSVPESCNSSELNGDVQEQLCTLKEKSKGVAWKWMIVTTGVMGISFLIGSIIPFFGDLMNVYSSLGIFSLSFFIPVLFWMMVKPLTNISSKKDLWKYAINGVLVALALCGCVLGIWAAIKDIIHNWKVCDYHF